MSKSKSKELKLDLGCGPRKQEGYLGVDILPSKGVDLVFDLRKKWPWKNNSVDDAFCSHFVEHLDGDERVHFFNELFRVLKPGAKTTIITPHWGSMRAYGDPTHKWPPVSEFAYYYLNKKWRVDDQNAPHTKYTCDFDFTGHYNIHPSFAIKNQEAQQFGINHYREVAQDLVMTITKRQ